MDTGGAANCANGHGKRNLAGQVAVTIHVPFGKSTVTTVTGSVSVRAGLDGAPIVTGCDDDGVDSVHDSFVVCGGAVRVDHGKGIGFGDPLRRLLPGEIVFRQQFGGNGAPRGGQAMIGQVG